MTRSLTLHWRSCNFWSQFFWSQNTKFNDLNGGIQSPYFVRVWSFHKQKPPTLISLIGTTNVGTASCSLVSVCKRLSSHVTHSCWIVEATGCLASFLLWASVDCECQENQGCCVWSTQVCVSGFSIWGRSYRSTKLFQVSRCWAAWHKRYASCNTIVSNVREKSSFCIAS
jgi:hypothetical protein